MNDSETRIDTIIAFVMAWPALAIRAWALSKLWLWHVAIPFGAPLMTWTTALGLGAMASVAFKRARTEHDPALSTESVVNTTLFDLLCLGIGWGAYVWGKP